MKRKRLYRIPVKELLAVTVDYYLTIDDEADEKYGVCLVKTTDGDLVEEVVSVDRICRDQEEIEALISRLAQGSAMPVTLSDIIDDYLVQREFI